MLLPQNSGKEPFPHSPASPVGFLWPFARVECWQFFLRWPEMKTTPFLYLISRIPCQSPILNNCAKSSGNLVSRLAMSNSRLNPDPNRVSKSCARSHVKGKVFACKPTNLGTTDPSDFSASQRSRGETNCRAIRWSCIRKGPIQASKFSPLFSIGNSQGHLVHLLPKSAGWGCSCSFKRGTLLCKSSRRFRSSDSVTHLLRAPALVPIRRIGGHASFSVENLAIFQSQNDRCLHSSSSCPVKSKNTR